MKRHVYRPLFVVIAFVILILAARWVLVPKDFGAHEMGYRFGWHRKSNEAEWKNLPVKFAKPGTCTECHEEKAGLLAKSPHATINCQDCHGPALNHPDDPPKLTIDKSRGLCLRCHAKILDVGTARAKIPGIRDAEHNPDAPCAECHDPHNPAVK